MFTGTNAIIAAAVLSISALDAAVDFDFLWTREADFGTTKGLLLRDVYASTLIRFFFFCSAGQEGACLASRCAAVGALWWLSCNVLLRLAIYPIMVFFFFF